MPRIAVYGAGSIGCYVGGRLAAVGADVVFVGRQRIADEVREHGLRFSDLDGADVRVAAVDYRTDPDAVVDASLVLVTVKSSATPDVAAALAPLLRNDAVVVSLQNGLSNAVVLREKITRPVLTGMVPFNVVAQGEGLFHQGSEGGIEVEDSGLLAPYLSLFDAAGLPLTVRSDMDAVLWAKLLLNLNNPINALSGLPLKTELSQRSYRRCIAAAQREALAVGKVAGRTAARLTPLPPAWIPRLLTVPDIVFRNVASSMLAIDPLARSSMWEDLEAGRVTEVDWINGEVVRLGREYGVATPVNDRLVELIRDAERGGRRNWSGPELLDVLLRR
ncbi:2-dehydropantoate 2-reductase [Rhodococcus artemisiae]|uniref:2-dehydropantoate 2-reductase n=1 Tax=Rhodococcus artemisiae TaxID=714159 RepID=A0ABU7LF78_9NOCA|nr:2-dehydropantoate 2-reductase [Rhodococcus artemisiae]MEE2060216.1 2-dehydropantoate 2-reductase [Rhodococcus artemisiae]